MAAGGLAEVEWTAAEGQLTGEWARKGKRKGTGLAELCLVGLAGGGWGGGRPISAI